MRRGARPERGVGCYGPPVLRGKTKATTRFAPTACPSSVAGLNAQVWTAFIAGVVSEATFRTALTFVTRPAESILTSSTTAPQATLLAGYFANVPDRICGGTKFGPPGAGAGVNAGGGRTRVWNEVPPGL